MISNIEKSIKIKFLDEDIVSLNNVKTLLEETIAVMYNESIESVENENYYFSKDNLETLLYSITALSHVKELEAKINK